MFYLQLQFCSLSTIFEISHLQLQQIQNGSSILPFLNRRGPAFFFLSCEDLFCKLFMQVVNVLDFQLTSAK